MVFVLNRQSGRMRPHAFELKTSDVKVSLLNYVKSFLLHVSWEYLLHAPVSLFPINDTSQDMGGWLA